MARPLFNSIIASVFGVCIIGALAGCAGNAANSEVDINAIDPNAVEGQASYKTSSQMQAAEDAEIDSGMFNIAIASRVEFESAGGSGNAYIENVPKNSYNMRVTIQDEVTGDVLYQTGIIEPNHHIDSIKLNKSLDAGEHRALARFTAIDPATGEEVGNAGAIVTLIIPSS